MRESDDGNESGRNRDVAGFRDFDSRGEKPKIGDHPGHSPGRHATHHIRTPTPTMEHATRKKRETMVSGHGVYTSQGGQKKGAHLGDHAADTGPPPAAASSAADSMLWKSGGWPSVQSFTGTLANADRLPRISLYIMTFQVSTGKSASLNDQSNGSAATGSSVGS